MSENTTPTNNDSGQSQATNQPSAITWATISKMTPKEYAARQPELAAWIAQHPSPRKAS